MKTNVYIVIKDCVFDYDADITVEPFGSLDEAVSRFNNLVKDYRSSASDDEWVIEEDSPHCFSAYEDGYAAQNHSQITLQISEINLTK